ncbi:hypothetical protein AVDCRST_MAG81-2437 [uncultured Synechococcales cyanobacterium]|uniref:Uncharacterized protein n=1 Tax=uncultured Synechococcales cyanobacterium TaxID=1936017 RepID=A0A6J4VHI3_9CYAN|nr:hypothetical protein AVDCRST_MAG81-2437 [uncultured Synechococcales cyanobacterium]
MKYYSSLVNCADTIATWQQETFLSFNKVNFVVKLHEIKLWNF